MTRELTPATKLAIQRQHDGPWCVVCGNSMPQAVVDMGYQTHPRCDPHEVADPLVAQSFSSPGRGTIETAPAGASTPSGGLTGHLEPSERNG